MAAKASASRRASNMHAGIYAWLFEKKIHLYFQLFSQDFFACPAGWTCIKPDGTKAKGDVLVRSDGSIHGDNGTWIFNQDTEFTLEFPETFDMSGTGTFILIGQYDDAAGFSLVPLKGKELSVFGPETRQEILDAVLEGCEYMYQYYRLMTDTDTGEVKMVAWFQKSEKVPPQKVLEDNPELFFDGCQCLVLRRELKPGYVIEDSHGGIKESEP
jgi:hypothetical protein